MDGRARRRRRDVFALWGATGEVKQPDGRVRGLHAAEDGQATRGIPPRSGGQAADSQGDAMSERPMQSSDPDGGVILVAVVVFAALAFVLGAFVGFSAAAVLR